MKSLCAVYAHLIRSELKKSNPDLEAIDKYLTVIEKFCRDVQFVEEVPTHLKPYLIRKGECAGLKGVAVYKGKLVPKVAKCIAEKRKRKV